MQESDFSLALAVLRLIRGWSQDELARHSGVRSSSISDYERGKIVPGANTLERLLVAMDYPFSALDGARTLISSLKADQALREAARFGREPWPDGSAPPGSAGWPASRSEAERQEIEQASLEAGRAVARLTRVFLSLVGPETFSRATANDESQAAS